MGGSSIFWLVVIVIAVVVEACTVQLVSVWMAIGGVGALIAGLCGAPFWVQTAVFAGVTALALLISRPMVKKVMHFQKVDTNACLLYTSDEREQTLNQLLTEMDGFDGKKGVVILAATNRPDSLDKALLRPGRFDRRIPVELPDLAGREAILKVHAKKIKVAPDIDYNAIARATAGASGAELANIINEAALRAVRCGHFSVTQACLLYTSRWGSLPR